jgi:large subunit ribosomal protein L10
VADILEKARGVFITDFQGLNVEKMAELRQKCREASVSYLVVKNTLARLAARKAGCEDLVAHFQGPSGLAYSYEDAVAPARVVSDFAKSEEKPTIKASLFEGIFYGPDKVQVLAALPSRNELIAKMLGGFNAPIQGLVSGLSGLIQKCVRTFDAVRQAKEEAA